MAAFEIWQAPGALQVLGIAPRRLMAARRSRITGRIAGQQQGRRRTMEKIEDFLVALRRAGRRAILIVDADCGDGQRLIEIATRARTLGFRVIDAKGFDPSPLQIAAARRAAAAHGNPAIAFDFAILDRHAPLALEEGGDGQADLLLAGSGRPAADLVDAMDRDGLLIRQKVMS